MTRTLQGKRHTFVIEADAERSEIHTTERFTRPTISLQCDFCHCVTDHKQMPTLQTPDAPWLCQKCGGTYNFANDARLRKVGTEPKRVEPGMACPQCHEDRADCLVNDGRAIRCLSCGTVYEL